MILKAYLEDGNTDAETINELENIRTVVFINDLEGRKKQVVFL